MPKKAVIVYQSKKTGNTKQLVDEAARRNPDVAVLHISQADQNQEIISQAELVVLASGIYMGKPDKNITKLACSKLKADQRVFVMLTHGSNSDYYGHKYKACLNRAGVNLEGIESCQGRYDFGPFKLVGGMHNGTPASDEINRVVSKLEEILQ